MSSYKKIVVGTDGSDTSLIAVERAAAIARTAAGLLIVTAYKPASRPRSRPAQDASRRGLPHCRLGSRRRAYCGMRHSEPAPPGAPGWTL